MGKIKTVRDHRLNILPVTVWLAHDYVFEGPCRFGLTEEALSKEFDQMAGRSSHQAFVEGLKENLPDTLVNILDPIYIERNEDFGITEEAVEAIRKGAEQADMIFSNTWGNGPLEDYYNRYKPNIPLCNMQNCCGNYQNTATWRARGFEAFAFENWDDALEQVKILRARKALRDTTVLLAPRGESTRSLTVTEGFLNMEEVTLKLGTRFRYVNAHEVLDQTEHVPCDQNHTQPGKRLLNPTPEDDAKVAEITKDLIAGAGLVDMPEKYVTRSVDAWATIQRLLEANECNAFTMPCADVCGTRRYNEEKFTMCLTHSLNNEMGICSACEYDVPAVLCMVMLSALSDSEPYCGNTAWARPVEKGDELNAQFGNENVLEVKDQIAQGNVFYTFHSVPGRKMHGYDEPASDYNIRPFAAVQRFGATIRYDFKQDKGQVVTMARLDPTCSKIVIGRGTIIGGVGFDSENCSEGVLFTIKEPKKFLEGCYWCGVHVPLVYGDVFDEMVSLAKLLGLEVFTSE